MNIVFFTHPHFLNQQSMPRFVKMLTSGMKKRGHKVEVWMPSPYFFNLPSPLRIKKWMGYIDQFLLFPYHIKKRMLACSSETLFVFTDHALGPWIPILADRPHVIHCHDFLAQRSALGEIEENVTSWSGRYYQKYIHAGYTKGRNFISVSYKTQKDLHNFLTIKPQRSEVVWNGLSQNFSPINPMDARYKLGKKIKIDLSTGFFLHVGGNDWYKNKIGVIEIYNSWCSTVKDNMPLLLIGNIPNQTIEQLINQSPYKKKIHIIVGLEDKYVRLAYAGAKIFLFPSLAEGFGWPIAEAMASGCPVITTQEAPMTEVGENTIFYIPKKPHDKNATTSWAKQGAQMINKILNMPKEELRIVLDKAILSSKRFDKEKAIDRIESIYKSILFS